MIVLSAAIPTEREEWLRVWNSSAAREPFAHPSFVELFADAGDDVCCILDNLKTPLIVLPIILRPIARELWADSKEYALDATSPYGFGGPYGPRGDASTLKGFWKEYDDFARDRCVAATFLRLDLFAAGGLVPPWDVVDIRTNVVVGLEATEAEIWSGYEHKVRKNVNTARRNGLVVEVDPEARGLESFINIYESTMVRRAALSAYRYKEAFFRRITEELSGSYVFFHVRDGNAVVSSELVLLSERRLYSFLGGTLAEAFPLRPNDLLKHSAIVWGLQRGYEAFVLGGGYERDDGILRYKLGFAPRGGRSFRGARHIHSPEDYERLRRRRLEAEGKHGCVWSPRPDFFPVYRG